jgi:hypothetical protein
MQIHAASLDPDYADPYAFINMFLADPQEVSVRATPVVPTGTGAFLQTSATLLHPPVNTNPAATFSAGTEAMLHTLLHPPVNVRPAAEPAERTPSPFSDDTEAIQATLLHPPVSESPAAEPAADTVTIYVTPPSSPVSTRPAAARAKRASSASSSASRAKRHHGKETEDDYAAELRAKIASQNAVIDHLRATVQQYVSAQPVIPAIWQDFFARLHRVEKTLESMERPKDKNLKDIRKKNKDLTTQVAAQAAAIQNLQTLLEQGSSYRPIAPADRSCCQDNRRRISLLEQSIQDISNYIQELRNIQRNTLTTTQVHAAFGQVMAMEDLARSWQSEASLFSQKTIAAARQTKASFLAHIPEDQRYGNLALRIQLAYVQRILMLLPQQPAPLCDGKRMLLEEAKGIIHNELIPNQETFRGNHFYGQVKFSAAKLKFETMLKRLREVDPDCVVLLD